MVFLWADILAPGVIGVGADAMDRNDAVMLLGGDLT